MREADIESRQLEVYKRYLKANLGKQKAQKKPQKKRKNETEEVVL